MSQDGQLNDWFKSMSTVSARTRYLAGDLAYRGEQMQTRLNALTAATKYLADGGRLARDGAGEPMPGLGPGKDSGGGTRATMEAAAAGLGWVIQGGVAQGRARVEPRPRQPPPREVLEPRPRLSRYRRSSRADMEKEQRVEREGGKATPVQLRPSVRALTLPAEGREPGRDVQRKHLSQEDYEKRDTLPPPTTGVTFGEGVGGRIFAAIAACTRLSSSASRTRQHDEALDVERVGRRSHREPRTVVPPRTRNVGKSLALQGAAAAASELAGRRRRSSGECATADASGAALTLQLPEGPESPYLGAHSPQAPDEAKASQIGWLARATSAAVQAVTGSGGTAAGGSEEDEDDKGEAEKRASGSGREAEGDVDFTAERTSTRRRRSGKQRS